MNDHHYYNQPALLSGLMIEYPKYRLSEKGGFDFAVKEVRSHYLKIIEEIICRYDIDGIEIDWMRSPDVFRTGEV